MNGRDASECQERFRSEDEPIEDELPGCAFSERKNYKKLGGKKKKFHRTMCAPEVMTIKFI